MPKSTLSELHITSTHSVDETHTTFGLYARLDAHLEHGKYCVHIHILDIQNSIIIVSRIIANICSNKVLA